MGWVFLDGGGQRVGRDVDVRDFDGRDVDGRDFDGCLERV